MRIQSDLSAATVIDESGKSNVERSVQETRTASVQAAIPTEGVTDYEVDFKTFVDNHVRKTTKYQSAEELLDSNVPQKFIWICFGIPAVLGFLAGGPLGALLIGLFFGYPAALLTDFFKKYSATGPTEIIDEKIDSDDLVQFLNRYLSYLSPYFHEWGYISYSGIGARGALMAHQLNSVTSSSVRIGTEFGRKKMCFVVIWIEPDETIPDSDKIMYYFGTSLRLGWPSRYICAVKTVPILQAAMEYFCIEI